MNKRKHPLDVRTGARSLGQRKLAKDGTTWTPTEARTRDRLLRQFQRTGRKGSNVSSGNSEAFRENWDRIFGSARENSTVPLDGIFQDVREDPTLAPGTIRLEDGTGKVVVEIVNLVVPEVSR